MDDYLIIRGNPGHLINEILRKDGTLEIQIGYPLTQMHLVKVPGTLAPGRAPRLKGGGSRLSAEAGPGRAGGQALEVPST